MTPDQEAAQLRIHDLLTQLVEVIGPNGDGQAEWEPGEGPLGAVELRESVTVCFWVDREGDPFYTVVPGAGMYHHQTRGLLGAGLSYLGGYEEPGR